MASFDDTNDRRSAVTATLAKSEPALARAERALVVLIAAHSVVVGLLLLFATEWGARIGGFPELRPLFFARQGGAFHLVAAAAYLGEYFRHRGVSLLVLTKAIAVGFLALSTLLTHVPWLVPLSCVGDALMGGAVLVIRRRRGLALTGAVERA